MVGGGWGMYLICLAIMTMSLGLVRNSSPRLVLAAAAGGSLVRAGFPPAAAAMSLQSLDKRDLGTKGFLSNVVIVLI